MQGINRAEFAGCLARLKNLRNAVDQGAKIRFRDPLEVIRPTPAGAHHFTLYDHGIQRMSRDIVKVRAGIGEDLLAGRHLLSRREPVERAEQGGEPGVRAGEPVFDQVEDLLLLCAEAHRWSPRRLAPVVLCRSIMDVRRIPAVS